MNVESQTQEALWRRVCEARANSRAYRAADDPVVRAALDEWAAVFCPPSNVISFPVRGR